MFRAGLDCWGRIAKDSGVNTFILGRSYLLSMKASGTVKMSRDKIVAQLVEGGCLGWDGIMAFMRYNEERKGG